jgi:hypothetical protein
MTKFLEKLTKNPPAVGPQFLHRLSIGIVLFGILVRVVQYFSNRSLWGDEVWLATNLVNRSYWELLQPLDHNQAAPPGFLWTEKFAIQVFGNTEYALRLLPLVGGIISILAFYKLAKWALSGIAVPIALLLFACLRWPIYYATEVKQYSTDVMVALLLSLLLIPLQGQILKPSRMLVVGLIGGITVWFSHPAIFVLVGLEAANLITTAPGKRQAILFNRWPIYLMWALSFAGFYVLVTDDVMQNQTLQSAWGDEYPGSVLDILWLLDSFGRFFARPLGFPGITDGVALVAFVVGGFAFYRRDRAKLLTLMSPTLVTLAATYLHKYPFRGRLILFLAPFFILVIAEGIAFLLAQFGKRKYLAIAGVILACALLIPSSIRATSLLFHPETHEEVRPVLEYIQAHKQPGDMIYAGPIEQFEYYADRYGFSQSDYVRGYPDFLNEAGFSKQNWKTFQQQAQLKSNQRVWFLFSGLKPSKRALVKPRLDQIGQKLDYFEQPGSFTYLYQLK